MHRSKSRKSPAPVTLGEGAGAFAPTRGPQVLDGTRPRAYGSYLDVDCHGGTFAEATGHRIGKAMAAEPSSVISALAVCLPREAREFTMHNPRNKAPAQSLRTRAGMMPFSADDRRAPAMLATSGHDGVAQAWLSAHGPTPV